jgi:hypothetical protein
LFKIGRVTRLETARLTELSPVPNCWGEIVHFTESASFASRALHLTFQHPSAALGTAL